MPYPFDSCACAYSVPMWDCVVSEDTAEYMRNSHHSWRWVQLHTHLNPQDLDRPCVTPFYYGGQEKARHHDRAALGIVPMWEFSQRSPQTTQMGVGTPWLRNPKGPPPFNSPLCIASPYPD